VTPEVSAAVGTAIAQLETLGATIHEVSLPHSSYALDAYYVIAPAEASANLARYDGVKYGFRAPLDGTGPDSAGADLMSRTRGAGFGAEVKRRIMLGTYVLSAGYYDAYYLKAQQVRTLIRRDFERAFAAADVIAGPTSPTPAFLLGERASDPLQMYLADVFTVSAPLAGLPAISVPCGFSANRLPIGLQFTSRAWDEETMLRAADAYERATEWKTRWPSA